MGYDAVGPGLAGATKEMVMNENKRAVTKDEKALAEAIFTAAAASSIGSDQLFDFKGIAEYAIIAAQAFTDALSEQPGSKGFMDM